MSCACEVVEVPISGVAASFAGAAKLAPGQAFMSVQSGTAGPGFQANMKIMAS